MQLFATLLCRSFRLWLGACEADWGPLPRDLLLFLQRFLWCASGSITGIQSCAHSSSVWIATNCLAAPINGRHAPHNSCPTTCIPSISLSFCEQRGTRTSPRGYVPWSQSPLRASISDRVRFCCTPQKQRQRALAEARSARARAGARRELAHALSPLVPTLIFSRSHVFSCMPCTRRSPPTFLASILSPY
eukprot:2710995-Pleurochrysis_carterae.AAC.1